MQPVVALWIVVLLILLSLTICYKDHTAVATATVLESDCVLVKGAQPCVAKVKYEVNGAEYVSELVVKPQEESLVGMKMPVRYEILRPSLARGYQRHINIFAVPLTVWLLLGIAVLYFMYNPITVEPELVKNPLAPVPS
jgi:hypothetical protein